MAYKQLSFCKFRAGNGNRISSCKQNHNSGFTKNLVKAPNITAIAEYRTIYPNTVIEDTLNEQFLERGG